jgi:hypothetical protein
VDTWPREALRVRALLSTTRLHRFRSRLDLSTARIYKKAVTQPLERLLRTNKLLLHLCEREEVIGRAEDEMGVNDHQVVEVYKEGETFTTASQPSRQ